MYCTQFFFKKKYFFKTGSGARAPHRAGAASAREAVYSEGHSRGTHFTCFTSTNVQMLGTHEYKC
jgi:hypothetical protein